jgi:hypothetical protein
MEQRKEMQRSTVIIQYNIIGPTDAKFHYILRTTVGHQSSIFIMAAK